MYALDNKQLMYFITIVIQMLMNVSLAMEAVIRPVQTHRDRIFAVVLDSTPLMMINMAA